MNWKLQQPQDWRGWCGLSMPVSGNASFLSQRRALESLLQGGGAGNFLSCSVKDASRLLVLPHPRSWSLAPQRPFVTWVENTDFTLVFRACLWSATSMAHSTGPGLRMNKVQQVRLAKPSTFTATHERLARVVWTSFSVVCPNRMRVLCVCERNYALLGRLDRTVEISFAIKGLLLINSTLSIMSEKRDVLFGRESMVGKYFIIELQTCGGMDTWNRHR